MVADVRLGHYKGGCCGGPELAMLRFRRSEETRLLATFRHSETDGPDGSGRFGLSGLSGKIDLVL